MLRNIILSFIMIIFTMPAAFAKEISISEAISIPVVNKMRVRITSNAGWSQRAVIKAKDKVLLTAEGFSSGKEEIVMLDEVKDFPEKMVDVSISHSTDKGKTFVPSRMRVKTFSEDDCSYIFVSSEDSSDGDFNDTVVAMVWPVDCEFPSDKANAD